MKNILWILLTLSLNLCFAQQKSNKTQQLSLLKRSNSTISVNYNTNITQYHFSERQGLINTRSQFLGYGLGFSKNFYNKSYKTFLTAGIKYFNAKSYLEAGSNIYGINPNYGSVTYALNYDRVVIPVYFGKNIKIFNSKKMYLESFGGMTFGVGYMAKLRTDSYLEKSNNDNDTVGIVGPYNTMDLGPFHFYSSIDLGFRIAPFNIPNFSLGVLATMDLTKSNKYQDQGSFINYSKGIQQDYKFIFDVKHINLMFSINYTFGKKWKRELIK